MGNVNRQQLKCDRPVDSGQHETNQCGQDGVRWSRRAGQMGPDMFRTGILQINLSEVITPSHQQPTR